MSDQPFDLYGFAPSVYVRSVRLALEEKALPYVLHELDPFQPGGPPAWYRSLHPFGKIPSFRDGGVELFESDAILRYLEAAYPEHPLTPSDPPGIARMTQVMRIMDGYAYPAMIWTVFVMLARDREEGRFPLDEGLAQSRKVLDVLDRLMPQGAEFLAGTTLTLADTHALPMLVYFAETAPGRAMLAEVPRLNDWLARMRRRRSTTATRSPLEVREGE
ncbi:glutathione S-transferase III [alpha proteobacterium BAL199]|jgi:glutathione S-transferase|nr:glutathione S-transferase III [alpha proteobacterium BAL199]